MKASERIKQISKKYGYSHIGSCLSCLPILEAIYTSKGKDDLVILDNAHSHVAHLVVREQYENLQNIEGLLQTYGIHCDRLAGCDATGGSLGHGLGIAIGRAIANKDITIHVIISEGGLMEGSIYESLRLLTDLNIKNIKVYLNLNGYSAVAEVDGFKLRDRVKAFYPEVMAFYTENGDGFSGIQGHYTILK